jgi:hypothetical protein
MKSKLHLIVAAIAFITAMTIVSCKKESSSQTDTITDSDAQQISTENADAETQDNDVTDIGLSTSSDLQAQTDNRTAVSSTEARFIDVSLFLDLQFKIGPCTKVTVTPLDSTWPKTVTINYGDGCFCRDGKFRKGSIVLTFSAPIRKSGAVLTITLNNYYVNQVHIEGTKTITNGSDSSAHKLTVQVQDGKATWPSGRGFTYNSLKTYTQVQGMATASCRDDVYSIEGKVEVKYANGTTVVKETETPLLKPVACQWIDQGILKITINSRVFELNFGDGTCDNKAILSWGNKSVEIILP